MHVMPWVINTRTTQMITQWREASSDMDWNTRKGIRFGYNYANKADESDRLQSPHMFAIGFEMQQTMDGDSWLDLAFYSELNHQRLGPECCASISKRSSRV
jgi:hypothetical protein